MRVEVRVDWDIVRLRFQHCLVCGTAELCLCDDGIDCCKHWNFSGGESGQSQRVLVFDDRGCGAEVRGEERGVVGYGDIGSGIGAESQETPFVGVRAEHHRNLWANGPGLGRD
jgi:hypothetical protein